jgi:hypothetical protein
MAQHPERIEKLVERSSFGDPDARRARARVTDATARELLHRVRTTPTTGAFRSGSRSTNLGQFRRPRGTSTS